MKIKLIKFSQRGIVLLTAVILLFILTLIGIASMNSTALTEKMTQNLRDSSTAFEAAESGLGDAEMLIQTMTTIPTPVATCSAAPCLVWQYNALGTFYQQPDSWWQANARPFSATIANVALQPYYIIEQFNYIPTQLSPDAESKGQGYYYYRITARGTGATDNAHAVVQTIYATQFN